MSGSAVCLDWVDWLAWAGWADWTVIGAPCVSMTCLRVVRWGGVDEVRLTVTCDVQVTAMTGAGCEPADPGGVSQAVT